MQPRSLQYIAQACAGEQLTGDPKAVTRRVCTDSRRVRAGDVFFAIPGECFDGHDFLAEVAAKKALAAVVERNRLPVPSLPLAIIAVAKTREALGRLAARYRCDFTLPVIAVGGSNGKTSTKEMTAAVLRQKCATLWSEASFNNDIGVPLTLLELEPHHQAAVLEAGTNHPGELAPLVAMIQPQYGVITALGREHLEFFGSLDGVVREEGVLAELLPPNGRLFLNTDHDWAECVARRSRAPVVRVGWQARNDWSAAMVKADDQGATFTVNAPRPGFSGEFRINLLGRHQVSNALLAIAVAAEMGLSAEEVARGLNASRPLTMRLQLWEANGVRVLDDAYNANADSVLAALQTLHDLPCSGRRLAVLGDMAELGDHTAAAHAEIGRRAAEFGVDQLVAVGRMAGVTAAAARDAGLQDVCEFSDVTQAAQAIKTLVQRGDLVLLKASRVTGLERVGEALQPSGSGNPA